MPPLLACTLGALSVALATAPASPLPVAVPPTGPLHVSLVFGPEADLDLYVTGPLRETVYFAKPHSRSGGALEADLRCDAPAPRVERVVFPRPLSGRYRVSVDFPERCTDRGAAVPFLVVVEDRGTRRETRGEITFGDFQSIVVEFDVPERSAR